MAMQQDLDQRTTSSENAAGTSSPEEDNRTACLELGDAVEALRAGEVGWSGLEHERLLTALESALDAHRAGTASSVTLDARALLEVLRSCTPRTVASEVAEAAKAHTRSALADPTRGGRAGTFLFGSCGMPNEVTREIDQIMALEIERAYAAGAALTQEGLPRKPDAGLESANTRGALIALILSVDWSETLDMYTAVSKTLGGGPSRIAPGPLTQALADQAQHLIELAARGEESPDPNLARAADRMLALVQTVRGTLGIAT